MAHLGQLVDTWDAAEKEYFPMRAALLTTVHDILGFGYLAGQVVTERKTIWV